MEVIQEKYKCAVCGEENEYLDYLSNFISGYSDFDMKPVGSMMGIGENIMECPNCHYASYRIDTTIDQRFTNHLKWWNNDTECQEIIKNFSGSLRKILLVAKQHENNMDYSEAYKLYIMASWVSYEKDASNFRVKAYQMFVKNELPKYTDNLLQIADIMRMEGKFDNAKQIACAVKNLTNESDKKSSKIIDAEIGFINSKDSKRHNLGEIFIEL